LGLAAGPGGIGGGGRVARQLLETLDGLYCAGKARRHASRCALYAAVEASVVAPLEEQAAALRCRAAAEEEAAAERARAEVALLAAALQRSSDERARLRARCAALAQRSA
jgi:hypothetical protein